jgi:hypothetical protein
VIGIFVVSRDATGVYSSDVGWVVTRQSPCWVSTQPTGFLGARRVKYMVHPASSVTRRTIIHANEYRRSRSGLLRFLPDAPLRIGLTVRSIGGCAMRPYPIEVVERQMIGMAKESQRWLTRCHDSD